MACRKATFCVEYLIVLKNRRKSNERIIIPSTGMGMMEQSSGLLFTCIRICIYAGDHEKNEPRRNEMMSKMAVGDTVLTSSGF